MSGEARGACACPDAGPLGQKGEPGTRVPVGEIEVANYTQAEKWVRDLAAGRPVVRGRRTDPGAVGPNHLLAEDMPYGMWVEVYVALGEGMVVQTACYRVRVATLQEGRS